MSNRDVARVLLEIAALLEIRGENPFRVRSYRLAGEAVAAHGEDVAEMLRRGADLRRIENLGASLAAKVQEIVASGSCAQHRELLGEMPAGLLDLLRIPGLGPKGVAQLWRGLGVSGPDDLAHALAAGRVRSLPGMKEKKEARLREGLEALLRRRAQPEVLAAVAAPVAAELGAHLLDCGAAEVLVAGDLRRRCASVGEIALVVLAPSTAGPAEALASHPDVRDVQADGPGRWRATLASGLRVRVCLAAAPAAGAALLAATGTNAHWRALQARALPLGLRLEPAGLFRAADGGALPCAHEEQVYAALHLPWVPPELREDQGELAAAEAGRLPRLVELADLRGDLHAHSLTSDGRESAAAMAAAARARGLGYLALTEHSRAIPSPTHGRGLDEARCFEHVARVRALQQQLGPEFRLLAGAEVDILPDGSLDLADEALQALDFVVASIHSAYDLERSRQTARVLRALAHPQVHVWGHPLARRLPDRAPIDVDFEAVLQAALRHGVALEINGQPSRLDLPDALARSARLAGARFVLASDAHTGAALAHIEWAVGQARRAWLEPADVLNTLPVERLLAERRRPRSAPMS